MKYQNCNLGTEIVFCHVQQLAKKLEKKEQQYG